MMLKPETLEQAKTTDAEADLRILFTGVMKEFAPLTWTETVKDSLCCMDPFLVDGVVLDVGWTGRLIGSVRSQPERRLFWKSEEMREADLIQVSFRSSSMKDKSKDEDTSGA